MVRLVRTDFSSLTQNKDFYSKDEYSSMQKMFTYENFKAHEVFLKKEDTKEDIYSLNILSKKYLPYEEFLVYISTDEFYIVFNHKTTYYSKINNDFFMDDIMKAILITKHISKLSNEDEAKNIHLLLNTNNNTLLKKLFQENTKNLKQRIFVSSLEDVTSLVKGLNPLITNNSFILRNVYILSMGLFVLWFLSTGMTTIDNRFIKKHSLKTIKKAINIETLRIKRTKKSYLVLEKEYKKITKCLDPKDIHVSLK